MHADISNCYWLYVIKVAHSKVIFIFLWETLIAPLISTNLGEVVLQFWKMFLTLEKPHDTLEIYAEEKAYASRLCSGHW